MRLNVKNRAELEAQIADYVARGGEIKREDTQAVTKRMKRAMSLSSRHLGKHNRMGQRV